MDTINTFIGNSASYGFDAYSKACNLTQSLYQNGASVCSSAWRTVSSDETKKYFYDFGTSSYESLKNTATTLYSRTVTEYIPEAEKGFSGLQRISTAFGEKVRKSAPESMQGAFAPSQTTGMSVAVMTVAALPFAVPYLESKLTNYSCGRELSRQKQLQQEVMANAAKQTPEQAIISLQERSDKLNETISGHKAILNRSCFSLSNLAKTLLVAGSSFVLAPYVTGAQLGVYAGAGIAHMVYRNVSNTSQNRSQVAELESMKTNIFQTMVDKWDMKGSQAKMAKLEKERAEAVEEMYRQASDRRDAFKALNGDYDQFDKIFRTLDNEKAQLKLKLDTKIEQYKELTEKYEALLNDPTVLAVTEVGTVVSALDKNKIEIERLQRLVAEEQEKRNALLQDMTAKEQAVQAGADALKQELANRN